MSEPSKKNSQYCSLLMSKIQRLIKKLTFNWGNIVSNPNKKDILQQINNFLDSQEDNSALEKKKILKNFIKFNNKTADDIMIPRTDIIAVQSNISLEELKQFLVERPITRVLVYQDNLDNILGFIHIKDLFKLVVHNNKFDITTLIRKPIIATHIISLWDLLHEMQAKKIHIAIIIDEYGGLDGIVTLENIITQIFGQIDDEYTSKEKNNSYRFINPRTIIASGRMRIDVLENILGKVLKTDDEDLDTISGLVMKKAGMVLGKGDKITIADDVEVEVIEANSRTIKTLKLTFNPTSKNV